MATAYLAEARPQSGAVAELVAALAGGARLIDITTRIDLTAGEDESQSADLLLFAIRYAVSDHALTDQEARDLRHLQRVLRIEEGDLAGSYPGLVGSLLGAEMERLLEDQRIDPAEALHKVRLQEVLGLGYDDFVELASPEVGRVISDLVGVLERGGIDLGEFRRAVLALDTVFDLNPPGSADGGSRCGYVYLLANPAMPGIVKIGRTNRPPDDRVNELSSATGVPTPFELVYSVYTNDCHEAERRVHDWLSERGARVAANREFFAVPVPDAIRLLMALEAKPFHAEGAP